MISEVQKVDWLQFNLDKAKECNKKGNLEETESFQKKAELWKILKGLKLTGGQN